MKFRQKQLLNRHINLIHRKDYIAPARREKKHECPDCGRTFTFRGNLIRHMEVHDISKTQCNSENYKDLTILKDETDISCNSNTTTYLEQQDNSNDEDVDTIDNLEHLLEKEDNDPKLQTYDDNVSICSSQSDIIITICETEKYDDNTSINYKSKGVNNETKAIINSTNTESINKHINMDDNSNINFPLDLDELEMNVMETIDIEENKSDDPFVLKMSTECENSIEILETDGINMITDDVKDSDIEYIYEDLGAENENENGNVNVIEQNMFNSYATVNEIGNSLTSHQLNTKEDPLNLQLDDEIVILEVIQCGDVVDDN